MRIIALNRRYARIARRRSGEQGLTLIELLLSLAILAVLTSFLAGGLSMGRRAFDADRANRVGSASNAAIQVISNLIGSAVPGQVSSVMFDGRQGAMLFVGLSEGRSLRGGPHKFSLRQSGSDLVLDVIASPTAANVPEPSPTRVVVLSGVSQIHFEYFGKTNASAVPSWHTDWSRAEHLPDLVSVRCTENRIVPCTILGADRPSPSCACGTSASPPGVPQTGTACGHEAAPSVCPLLRRHRRRRAQTIRANAPVLVHRSGSPRQRSRLLPRALAAAVLASRRCTQSC